MDKELVRVKGREGITPLHFVSQTGDSDLLATFLSACPDSIEDVTVRRETALHVALKHKRLESFQVLVGWLSRNTRKGAACLQYSIFNRKDEEGNTILHLSAINNDLQALDLLINTKTMEVNAQNLEKLTALDKAASKEMEKKLLKAGAIRSSCIEVRPTLADELRSNIIARKKVITNIKRIRESMPDSHREAYLVVAALILTAIYQSALSPPGGLYQSEIGAKNSTSAEAAGKSVLSSTDFFVFSLLNKTVLFFTVLLTSLILIPTGWGELGKALVQNSNQWKSNAFLSLIVLLKCLYALIEANPYILEEVDSIPFVETPLHTAASAGHIHFATEIVRLKPSFALKLDTHGLNPID
ncbi:hypothetical protein PIB30_066656 [Stylosanthes scabra]|uniref:PGG domain-containing protein n=1 Tax=Stylosanthes scabra TaxID=79078 RepID=A0ABU6SP97_9FABA|nr:hypothetical protein [Stylosanthes scabra]